MTFGDVLAITLLIVVTVVTLWAGIVAFTVVFARRAQIAADALVQSPGKQIGIGFVIALIAGIGSVSIMSKGGPVAAVGFMILAAALAIALVGSSGLATVIAGRLREQDPRYSQLSSTVRGAALSVAVGLIPVIGWFFLMPAALLASLGAGMSALTAKRQARTEPERQAISLVAE